MNCKINKKIILGASIIYVLTIPTLSMANNMSMQKCNETVISYELQPKSNYSIIEINAKNLTGVEIKSIKLPDNTVVKSDKASFKVKKSGVYTFEITDVNGKITTHTIKVDISDTRAFQKFLANFNPKISSTQESYNVNHGELLKIEFDTNKVDVNSISLDIEGIEEAPLSLTDNEATFYLDHIKEGVYTARLKGVNNSTNKEYISDSFELIIPGENKTINTNSKATKNLSSIINLSKGSYSIMPGDSLYLEYSTKNNETVDYTKLCINGEEYLANYYSKGNATFYLNDLKEGTYKATLKGLTFTGESYTSNEFTIKIGNSNNSVSPEQPSKPTTKPEETIKPEQPSTPITPDNSVSSSNSITVSKGSYSIMPGDSLYLEYSTKNNVTVDYTKLCINGEEYLANYYSKGNATFYLNDLKEGTYKATLKGFAFTGESYTSNEFTIKIGNSNDSVAPEQPSKPTTKPEETIKPEQPSTPTTPDNSVSSSNSITVSKGSYSIMPGDSLYLEYSTKNNVTVDYTKLIINGEEYTASYYSKGNANFYLNDLKEGTYKATLKGLAFTGESYTSNEFTIKIGNSNDSVAPEQPSKPTTKPEETVIDVPGNKFYARQGDVFGLSYSVNQNIKSVTLNIGGVQIPSNDFSNYYAQFNLENVQVGQNLSYLTVTDSNGRTVKSNNFIVDVEKESNNNNNNNNNNSTNTSSEYTPKDSMSAIAHEGIPNGAPADWKYKPRIENLTRPSGWNAIGQWGGVYLEEGYDYAENTAIEISNFKMYGYSETTKEWKLINHSIPGDGFYVEDFAGDANKRFPNKIKVNYNDKSLIVKLDKDTKGYCLHPFSQQIDTRAIGLPDVKYVISQMDVRLVKWDENGIDDRDKAHYVANVGGDWWRNVGDVWQPDWSTNVGIAQGQFRTIEKEWKSLYMTTIPVDKYDEIVKN